MQQPSQALPSATLDRIEYVTHCGDLLCHDGDHSIGPRCRSVCDPPRVSELAVVSVPQDRLDDLQLVWRALYEHHTALMRHLRDREVPFEQAWQSRREIERGWFASEPESFVLAAQDAGDYVGYAFVRVRPGAGFAASWRASDPLAELAILVVLPEVRGQGVGSMLLDAVEAKLRELGIEDMIIGVITTNTDAMRLYERRGAVPFLTQFVHRVHPCRD